MSQSLGGIEGAGQDALFGEAVQAAKAWGRASGVVTGMWLNQRRRTVGVGICEGGEVETTEALRALVPPGIRIRTRVASSRLAGLWQLQADVEGYLEEEHIWGRWAVSLSVDSAKDILQVGLLNSTPTHVAEQIRSRYAESPLVIVTATEAVAM